MKKNRLLSWEKTKLRSLRNEIIRPYSYLIMGLSIVIIIFLIFIQYFSALIYNKKLESEHFSLVKNEIVKFLDTPFEINQQNLDLYTLDVIQNLTMSDFRVIFANQYQRAGHITLIGFGLEDGTYLDVQYLDGKDLYSSVRNPETGDTEGWRIDRSGNIISLERSTDYDHRKRPWYSASKGKKPGWTQPYISINPKSIFLTAFYPLHSNSEGFWGTMVSSISLTGIGNIIRSVDSIGDRDIYILEHDGKIIASNKHEVPFNIKKGHPERIYATESQNEVLSAILNSNNIIENDIELMWTGFKPYFVGIHSINDGRGIDWQVYIINPVGELFRDIATRLLIILLLALLTVGIGVLIGRRIATDISKPILEIKNAANQIVQGNLRKRVEVSIDNEVGEMGISFNKMGETIYDLINKLEEKVEDRTRELTDSNKALTDSENRFRSLSDAAFEGIVISEKGNILETNDAMAKMFGYKITELVGIQTIDLVAPEVRDEVREKILSGYEKHYEVIGMMKNGTKFPIEVHAKMFSYKGREVRVTAVRDLTEQKRASALLKEREQLYRALFEKNTSVILLINPETSEIFDANQSACSYYGYSIEKLKNMRITDINILSEKEIFEEMNRAKSEKKKYFNFRHRLSDGTIRDVEVFSGPIIVQGKPLLCSIIHDVSERKIAEKEKESLISELQNAVDEIKTLKGIVPICSQCKKIRDDKGYWNMIETYIEQHSEALFSHGMCPECSDKLYGDQGWYIKMKAKEEK